LATFQQKNVGPQAAVGALFGYAAAIAVGYGLYQGGIRLNLGKFFQWTGVFIIFVAAGLLAGAMRAFHEAGLWNLGQTTVFDWSSTLPIHSVMGSVLAGVLGYTDAPTVSELVVYFGYLVPTMLLFFLGSKTQRRMPPQASS
ncbi:MAG: FTR1 family protein, partial [Elainella sp.]